MVKIRLLVLLLLSICFSLFAQEKLGTYVEMRRFLDGKNTRFDLDYQVPYKNLVFKPREKPKGFYAELRMTFSIANSDSIVYSKTFTNNIGVTNEYDLGSSRKAYLDRISFTLTKPGFRVMLDMEDINGQRMFNWVSDANLLPADAIISDLELDSYVGRDTTANSANFIRNHKMYKPEPSSVIFRELSDSLYITGDTYNRTDTAGTATLTLQREGKQYMVQTLRLPATTGAFPFLFRLKLQDLESGKYIATVKATYGDKTQESLLEFIINEQAEALNFLFTDPEEEYQLLRYFGNIKTPSNWRSMSLLAKRRNISDYWVLIAQKQGLSVNETLKMYKERIDYANRYFSHFDPGWKTDMGRIYIRNGAPDDIEKNSTSSSTTNYADKDYQIWKYSSGKHPVYCFVDVQMSGNFKLIYVANDDMETTHDDWRRYLGSDFDEELFNN